MSQPATRSYKALMLLLSLCAPGWLQASEPVAGHQALELVGWEDAQSASVDGGLVASLVNFGTEKLNLDFNMGQDQFKATYRLDKGGPEQLGVGLTYARGHVFHKGQSDDKYLGISFRYPF